MQKRVIFREVEASALNVENVIEEAKRRNITGYLKVVYWDSEDYLLFVDGEPRRSVTVSVEGRRLIGDPDSFSVKGKEGTATFVETTLDDIVSFLDHRSQIERDGPLVLFPYGTLTQEPVSLSFLDINKEISIAQRSHLTGYIALFTEEELIGTVVFSGGQPVALFGGNGSVDSEALAFININLVPSKSYMSMYSVEPEVLNFIVSLRRVNVRPLESVFMTYQEAREEVEKNKKDAVVLIESEGVSRYDLFFRGRRVESILKDKGFLVEEEGTKNKLSIKVENVPEKKVRVYEVSIIERLTPMEVSFEIATETAEETASPEVIEAVKFEFIKRMGPVGRVLWSRILSELRLKEGSITTPQLKTLVLKLSNEIPEEDVKREFLKKIREISPDMI